MSSLLIETEVLFHLEINLKVDHNQAFLGQETTNFARVSSLPEQNFPDV